MVHVALVYLIRGEPGSSAVGTNIPASLGNSLFLEPQQHGFCHLLQADSRIWR